MTEIKDQIQKITENIVTEIQKLTTQNGQDLGKGFVDGLVTGMLYGIHLMKPKNEAQIIQGIAQELQIHIVGNARPIVPVMLKEIADRLTLYSSKLICSQYNKQIKK